MCFSVQDAERVTNQIDHILTGEEFGTDLTYQYNFIFNMIQKYKMQVYCIYLFI